MCNYLFVTCSWAEGSCCANAGRWLLSHWLKVEIIQSVLAWKWSKWNCLDITGVWAYGNRVALATSEYCWGSADAGHIVSLVPGCFEALEVDGWNGKLEAAHLSLFISSFALLRCWSICTTDCLLLVHSQILLLRWRGFQTSHMGPAHYTQVLLQSKRTRLGQYCRISSPAILTFPRAHSFDGIAKHAGIRCHFHLHIS